MTPKTIAFGMMLFHIFVVMFYDKYEWLQAYPKDELARIAMAGIFASNLMIEK
jgi:hypothetical protein